MQDSFACIFFFKDTATTEIYTLSLHDALPIWTATSRRRCAPAPSSARRATAASRPPARRSASGTRRDRKSTRLNSSHLGISYAVFCLKKKKEQRKRLNNLSSTTHCNKLRQTHC